MSEEQEEYPRMGGVLMKPGVRVFCDDRDEMAYDYEGTITAVIRNGANWSFEVAFDGPGRRASGPSFQMDAYSISPTQEERDSEDARRWRAEHSLRVFLCHASEDKPAVRELYDRLKELGFKPWLDEIDLSPGVEWEVAIEAAVRESHVILVCMSESSTQKTGFVQKEIYFALDRALEMPEGAIYIVPVRLQECSLPKRLSKWQAVDLYSSNGENRLLQALRAKAQKLALLPGA